MTLWSLLILGQDPLRQNQEGGSMEGVGWEDVLGGDFVLRGPNPFLKSDQIVMVLYHMLSDLSHVV